MTQKTLTRADLSNAVYREIGLSLSESTQLVDGNSIDRRIVLITDRRNPAYR